MNQDPGEYGGSPTSFGKAEIGGGETLSSFGETATLIRTPRQPISRHLVRSVVRSRSTIDRRSKAHCGAPPCRA